MGDVETFLIGVYAGEVARLQIAQNGHFECGRRYVVNGPVYYGDSRQVIRAVAFTVQVFRCLHRFISAQLGSHVLYISEIVDGPVGEKMIPVREGDNAVTVPYLPERVLEFRERPGEAHRLDVINVREAVHALEVDRKDLGGVDVPNECRAHVWRA